MALIGRPGYDVQMPSVNASSEELVDGRMSYDSDRVQSQAPSVFTTDRRRRARAAAPRAERAAPPPPCAETSAAAAPAEPARGDPLGAVVGPRYTRAPRIEETWTKIPSPRGSQQGTADGLDDDWPERWGEGRVWPWTTT